MPLKYGTWALTGSGACPGHYSIMNVCIYVCVQACTCMSTIQNTCDQLKNISKFETTYFDMRGLPAYRKKRLFLGIDMSILSVTEFWLEIHTFISYMYMYCIGENFR